jgi:GH18 family chitinase
MRNAMFLILALFSGVAVYADVNWTGTNGSDWSDNGNWTEDPTNNSVKILNNTNSPIVGATDTITNLDIQKGAVLNIGDGVVLTVNGSYIYLAGWDGPSDTGTIALSGNGRIVHTGGHNLYMGDGPGDNAITLTDTSSIDWQGGGDSVFIGVRGDATMSLSGDSSLYVGHYAAFGWGGDLGYAPVCELNLEGNATFESHNIFYANPYVTSATVNMYDNTTFETGTIVWSAPAGGFNLYGGTITLTAGSDQTSVINEPWFNAPYGASASFDGSKTTISTASIVVVDKQNGVAVKEEGPTSDEYSISLALHPTHNVVIAVNFDAAQLSVSPNEILFSPGNWDQPQVITVTAVDDEKHEQAQHQSVITHTSTSLDSRFDNKVVDSVSVDISDNECGAWGHLAADINLDCEVNIEDYTILASQWLSNRVPNSTDLPVRIIGWYVYRPNLPMRVTDIRYDDVTHLVYNHENHIYCDGDGHIYTDGVVDNELDQMISLAHEYGIKVQVLFPVDGPDGTIFTDMMLDPAKRATYVSELRDFIIAHDLDGVEYDWEGRPGQSSEDWFGAEGQRDRQAFTDLVIETKQALPWDRNLVSFDGGLDPYFILEKSGFAYVDWVNVMSYTSNAFTTTANIAQILQDWHDEGMPKEKIHVGVPFYGKSWDGSQFMTYAEIQQTCPNLQPEDNQCGDIWFQGDALIEEKVQYVLDNNYGGFFCFYLNLDAMNEDSLLKKIAQPMRK